MICKPYGSWKSPLSGKSLVQSSLRLGQIQVDGSFVYWTEGRPAEKGRTALMRGSEDNIVEVTPAHHDVRTRAHEYGGGAFLCSSNHIFYVNNSDQQIYEIQSDGHSRQLTHSPHLRFADMRLDTKRNLLYVVVEDHSNKQQVDNSLQAINLENGDTHCLAEGHDFYSNPELSPDGSQLLFLCWDHPNMPWDGTRLMLGELDAEGKITSTNEVAGGQDESIFQPLWDLDGSFYFISDRSNWWNLYQVSNGQIHCVLEKEAEFGLPQWVFGMSMYAVQKPGQLVAVCQDLSGSHLLMIDVINGTSSEIDHSFVHVDQVKTNEAFTTFIGRRDNQPAEIVSLDFKTQILRTLRKAAEAHLEKSCVSRAEHIQFDSRPGESGYAWYYAPHNPDFKGPAEELPPLIVLSHGGPTSWSSNAFDMAIQYWTTRGFAVVDVNYSGSTGYGRDYRKRLDGQWGIRDVEDCTAVAEFLAARKLVDRNRLIIKGGSAGGFTTLAALTFGDVFKGGASYYGVGDLTMLARDTHKFESRYLDSLVGQYPEDKAVYLDRSPLNHAEQLKCPVIFLQGLDDPVVPPAQAETMVSALKKNGIPVAYLTFEGESHGFRKSSTVIKAIESEYYFYTQIFNIEPDESLEAIEIFNLN